MPKGAELKFQAGAATNAEREQSAGALRSRGDTIDRSCQIRSRNSVLMCCGGSISQIGEVSDPLLSSTAHHLDLNT
jgi:hypothetical protein